MNGAFAIGSRGLVVAAVATAAFVLDQVTKAWALSALSDGTVIPLMPSIQLRLAFNPGVAFGIAADAGAPLVIGLAVVLAALVGWICIRVFRGDDPASTALLALAAGGGVGNLWDRISRAGEQPLTGHVVDFIAVDWFAIFNVADIFTTCGFALWALRAVLVARSGPTDGVDARPRAAQRSWVGADDD